MVDSKKTKVILLLHRFLLSFTFSIYPMGIIRREQNAEASMVNKRLDA